MLQNFLRVIESCNKFLISNSVKQRLPIRLDIQVDNIINWKNYLTSSEIIVSFYSTLSVSQVYQDLITIPQLMIHLTNDRFF